MATLELPVSHVRFVFGDLLLRAGLITWDDFVQETCVAFGPDCGAAIADRLLAWRLTSATQDGPGSPVGESER
jgi:hypothetical protein